METVVKCLTVTENGAMCKLNITLASYKVTFSFAKLS